MNPRTFLPHAVCILLMLCVGLFPNAASAQDEPPYVQFETVYLKPDTKQLATLTERMKAHNDAYHSEEPYHATVWQVANGPKSGWLVWSMGPSTFAHLDDRPADNGHDEDWGGNVMPLILDMGPVEYWRLDQDLSMPSEGGPLPNLYIRFFEVNNEMSFLMGDVWEKMSETMKASPEGRSFAVYNNMFRQGDLGRHIAAVIPFSSWAELDNGMNLDPAAPGSFRDTFVGLYGEDAWMPFTRTTGVVFTNSHDEVWTLMPDMSAPAMED